MESVYHVKKVMELDTEGYRVFYEVNKETSNLELYRSYKESDIVTFVKIQRIKWAGHVIRMNEDRTTKKVFNAQTMSTRRKGRPNRRWMDGLEKIS
ncbi:uncharacterized protein TNCV_4076121 [Trichonephila clavipes]|nr:uncharacterized protein TNCV_4076121 [Trichonephila clavipes]